MATNPLSPNFFKKERTEEIIHETHLIDQGEMEFLSSVEELKIAQSALFSQEPEDQYKALQSVFHLSNQYGFGEGSLPPIFFNQIFELAFGNHASLAISEASLQVIESLIEKSPWTVNVFLSNNYHKTAFENIVDDKIGLPIDRLAFTLNSLMTQSEEAYNQIIELGYFKYLLEIGLKNLINADALWVLTSIQTIIVSPNFLEYESFHKIIDIALKYFNSNNLDIITNVFYILGRCLSSDKELESDDLARITTDAILQKAFQIIENKGIPDIRAAFNYVHNFICISNETTMKFIRFDFVKMLDSIFLKCDYGSQIYIFYILSTAAIEPVEATQEILRAPLLKYIPDILRTGKLSLKSAALSLAQNLILKSPFLVIFEYAKTLFEPIIELLSCEDFEILEKSLHILQYLTTRLFTLEIEKAKELLALFDRDAKESLYALLEFESPTIHGLANNIIVSLNEFCKKFEE
ncbi:hypothetical protein TRFO_22684 [Tritrichomonas foetus]|uniref:Importin N-terminal domain-containing protein n=1 Tax=Tritrichomonas foetus TaxID=1144522 RepID=A0A1J4KHG1_9EUKA|nr:hypothetical protein TRFO_22684 [Tritrichomonas foetus]|eukprot:OHT08765.1 hypothetical protein TRFO_22684 [Tritrichomonas foetus]